MHDKIVAISSILRRASRADDETAFWAQRTAFVSRVGYFHASGELAGPHVPRTMRNELDHVVIRAESACGRVARSAPDQPHDLRFR